MADFHNTSSRYVNTPVRDFYLDLWTTIDIEESLEDEKFVITSKYNERPDLLSYDRYQTPKLWWIFAKRNIDILIDPINDFKSGVEIFIPSLKNLGNIL